MIHFHNRLHALADKFATAPFIAGILVEQEARDSTRDHIAENDQAPAAEIFSNEENILQHAQRKSHKGNGNCQQARVFGPKRLRSWPAILHEAILAPDSLLKRKHFCTASIAKIPLTQTGTLRKSLLLPRRRNVKKQRTRGNKKSIPAG